MRKSAMRPALAAIGACAALISFTTRGQDTVLANGPAAAACSSGTVQGTYGFYRTGTTSDGPLAAVGIAKFDGHGQGGARQTVARNGVLTQSLFDPYGSFTYRIRRDCTGRFLFADSNEEFAHFVATQDGKEIFIISLTDGNSVTGVMHRIRD